MPKYEIGYILSSGISDDEVPNVTAAVVSELEKAGGKIMHEDHWGRKKLAYPIGRTRNGYYVFITADLAAEKVNDVEHLLRTNDAVIRFLIINMAEADRRKAKDEEVRARRRPAAERAKKQAIAASGSASNADLEEEIEKAIEADENL